MRIIVTGAAGLQGNLLADTLASKGHDVLGIDNLSRGRKLPQKADFRWDDCRSYDKLSQLFRGADVIYHLACMLGGVDYAHSNHWHMLQNNDRLDTAVMTAANEAGVKTFIYPSTACAYPVSKQQTWDARLTEEDADGQPEPESGYGWAKYMGEQKMKYLPIQNKVTFRLFNVYGPHENADIGTHLVPALIRKAIATPVGGSFEVYGDGTAGRSMLYVSDAVDAYVRALELEGSYTLNIGTPDAVRVGAIAKQIAALRGQGVMPRFDTTKPTGVIGRTPVIDKARKILGWEPHVGLYDGLQRTYEYYASLA